jgi:hypothetical protein
MYQLINQNADAGGSRRGTFERAVLANMVGFACVAAIDIWGCSAAARDRSRSSSSRKTRTACSSARNTYQPTEYHTYFRVLETADEYFDYYRRRHAFWKMYGLDLPDEVLKKICYKNALRVIPGLDASPFPP